LTCRWLFDALFLFQVAYLDTLFNGNE